MRSLKTTKRRRIALFVFVEGGGERDSEIGREGKRERERDGGREGKKRERKGGGEREGEKGHPCV